MPPESHLSAAVFAAHVRVVLRRHRFQVPVQAPLDMRSLSFHYLQGLQFVLWFLSHANYWIHNRIHKMQRDPKPQTELETIEDRPLWRLLEAFRSRSCTLKTKENVLPRLLQRWPMLLDTGVTDHFPLFVLEVYSNLLRLRPALPSCLCQWA